MVGIVVVAHSRPLAEAAVAFALGLGCITPPRIEVAAGIEDKGQVVLGTDATAVAAAIERLDAADGVLVLMDLGSAVMSAQLATDLLDPALATRVRLCPAPLVEGLVTAVAAASAGASLERVARQALDSLAGKQELLGGSAEPEHGRSGEAALTREVTVTSASGLHLRPASALATLVSRYDAEVRAEVGPPGSGRGPVSADSLAELLTLCAQHGDVLLLRARGPEAEAALDAVERLAAEGFGE